MRTRWWLRSRRRFAARLRMLQSIRPGPCSLGRVMTTSADRSRLHRRPTLAVILVVEDNPDTRELYRLVLESAGYEASSAISVHEALELLRARHFDVLLSDYSLG